MEALGSELGADVMLVTLTEDVVKSSAIEGEGAQHNLRLDRFAVSIASKSENFWIS